MAMNPPPLPKPPPAHGGKSFAHHAAHWSVVMPVLAILIYAAVQAQKLAGTPPPRLVLIAVLWVLILLPATGLVLAIVGLCGIPRHGKRGILGRGIAGVVLNGGILLLLFIIVVFVAGLANNLKSRQLFQGLKETEQQLQADQRKAFNPRTGITNVDTAGMERIRTQLDTGAQTLTGDDARIARVMSSFVARMEDATKKYQSALQELEAAHVLSLPDLVSQNQIAARRETVQQFLDVNADFAGVISNSAASLRANLTAAQVAPDKVDQVLAGFQSKWSVRGPLMLEIRDCDRRAGEGMLGILDVLDKNWGKWDYNPDTKLVKFTDAGAEAAYRQSLIEIRTASQEQVRAQGMLVNLPQ